MSIFNYFRLNILLTVFLILSALHYSNAQNRVNPFEVSPRLKYTTSQDTSKKAILKETVLTNIDTSNIASDSIITGNEIPGSVGQEKNPFEVDHLPLRKTTLSKKAEDLKSISDSTKSSTRFLFFFLLLGCALLAIVLNSGSKSLTLISKSLVNENMLKLFHREENIKPSSSLYLLYLIFCINLSAFVYLISIKNNGPSGIITYLIMLAVVVLVYVFRHTGLVLLGKIFPISKSTDLYSFTIMIFNHFIGLFLIPVNFLLAFGPSDFIPSIQLFALVFLTIIILLRFVRGIFIVSEYFSGRLFQIIIYLCAFEIAPVLILLKTVLNTVN